MGQEGDDFREMRELIKQRREEAAAAPRPLPRKKPVDRPITEREGLMYKMKTRVNPPENMMLSHFRRWAAGLRRRGGI